MNISSFFRKIAKKTKLLPWLYYQKQLFVYRERRSIGFTNEKECYFIVRRKCEKSGICSDLTIYLEQLNYMEKVYPHARPIVDMQNYTNSLLAKKDLGKYNAWNKLFIPFEYSLESAYKSRNYVLTNAIRRPKEHMEVSVETLAKYKVEMGKWAELFHKYIRFNAELNCFFDELEKSTLPESGRLLGVLCRGTDYLATRPHNHPIQPTVAQVMQKCEVEMQRQNYNYVVLATEDANIAQKFREKFREKCILTRDSYVPYSSGLIIDNVEDRLENSRKYLGQLYLLSRCQGLISGLTSAAPFILFMADDKPFEYTFFWDLGKYQ